MSSHPAEAIHVLTRLPMCRRDHQQECERLRRLREPRGDLRRQEHSDAHPISISVHKETAQNCCVIYLLSKMVDLSLTGRDFGCGAGAVRGFLRTGRQASRRTVGTLPRAPSSRALGQGERASWVNHTHTHTPAQLKSAPVRRESEEMCRTRHPHDSTLFKRIHEKLAVVWRLQ